MNAKRWTKSIYAALFVNLLFCFQSAASKLESIQAIDKDYIMVHFLDGEVTHKDNGLGPNAFTSNHEDDQDTVKTYGTALNTSSATATTSWTLVSTDDPNFTGGKNPSAIYRKTKLNGMAEKAWNMSKNDYDYINTLEHFIYLKLPISMTQGKSYNLTIDAETGSDINTGSFTFDIFKSRSEAVHVNLVGYSPDPSVKAADLYIWMGDGGARDYKSFEGKKVYIYNVATGSKQEVGTVTFWKANATEAQGYNLTGSSVWTADFSAFTDTGTFHLSIEDVGSSQDFRIDPRIYKEPYDVSLKGYFYMRIGQDSTGAIRPVPRRPLYIPGKDPSNTTVYITTLQPYDPNWAAFSSGGDPWDKKDEWAAYRKPGNPTNSRVYGGHSDAADWDRQLGHICNIYDMLLPYILTGGALSDDNTGIAESGNGIPDIIDEARNEVDFFLRLRDGQGYSHGVNNPNGSNVFYQAGTNAVAAWANAANASMLADAFRIAGNTTLMNEYRDSAVAAYNYANSLSDPLLDKTQGEGESVFRGRDFKITAAAFLYNVTGDTKYEQVINTESICANSQTADLDDHSTHDQIYATAAYLITPRTRNFPTLYANMKASVIYQAKKKNVGFSNSRPSRRASDDNSGYFQTEQNVHHTILAYAISESNTDRTAFRKAMVLEADWGLGRNPMNMIQMTTATTSLQSKRSVIDIYTSGRNDGSPGLHPGHTPYINNDDWSCGMVMGCPSWMTGKSYPAFANWPKTEGYFNTRYVWAHGEFTPQQTMRGKMALYGYLYGIGKIEAGQPAIIRGNVNSDKLTKAPNALFIKGTQVQFRAPGEYKIRVLDISGRVLWIKVMRVKTTAEFNCTIAGKGLRIIDVKGNGVSVSRKLVNF
jgi:endoglucanase